MQSGTRTRSFRQLDRSVECVAQAIGLSFTLQESDGLPQVLSSQVEGDQQQNRRMNADDWLAAADRVRELQRGGDEFGVAVRRVAAEIGRSESRVRAKVRELANRQERDAVPEGSSATSVAALWAVLLVVGTAMTAAGIAIGTHASRTPRTPSSPDRATFLVWISSKSVGRFNFTLTAPSGRGPQGTSVGLSICPTSDPGEPRTDTDRHLRAVLETDGFGIKGFDSFDGQAVMTLLGSDSYVARGEDRRRIKEYWLLQISPAPPDPEGSQSCSDNELLLAGDRFVASTFTTTRELIPRLSGGFGGYEDHAEALAKRGPFRLTAEVVGPVVFPSIDEDERWEGQTASGLSVQMYLPSKLRLVFASDGRSQGGGLMSWGQGGQDIEIARLDNQSKVAFRNLLAGIVVGVGSSLAVTSLVELSRALLSRREAGRR